MSIPENRTLRGAVIDYTSDRTLPLNECKIYFSPVQAGEGTPSPENVREISGWDSVTLNVNPRLPSEYQEVEYIESTGTQWIKTDIESRFTIEYESDISFTASQDSYSVGCKDGTQRISGNGYWNGTFQIGYGGSYRDFSVGGLGINTRYKLKTTLAPNNQNVYVNGVIKGTSTFSKTTGTLTGKHIAIFGMLVDDSSISQICKAKLYSLIIRDGDLLLGNFIPCYRISDHTPGMFDLVTNQFYTNSGTGNFILGPEVGITIDFPKTIYGGYVDLIRGEIVETHGVEILTGMESWTYQSENSTYNVKFLHKIDTMPISNNINKGITEYIPEYLNNNDLLKTGLLCCRFGWADKQLYIMNASEYLEGVSDLATFKNYLSENPLKVVYELDISNTYSIDPQDLRLLRGANKFSSNLNGDIEISFAAEEYPQLSGNIVTFNSPVAGKQFEECKVYFSPIQEGEGTPSPENVRPIRGWDGIELYQANNNIINSQWEQGAINADSNNVKGIYDKYKVNNATRIRCVSLIPLDNTKTYKIIWNTNLYEVVTQPYDINGYAFKPNSPHNIWQTESYEFGSLSNVAIAIRRKDGANITISEAIGADVKLISDYTILDITFPKTIYGGYVDLVNGEVIETLMAGDLGEKVIFSQYSMTNRCWSGTVVGMKLGKNLGTDLMCDSYETITPKSILNAGVDGGLWGYNTSERRLIIRNDNYIGSDGKYNTVALNNSLQGVIFVYPLETPNIYSLDIDNLVTLRNTNTLFSNANGNITVRAIGNVPAPIHSMDFVRRENAAAPHIESKTGNYLTFNTDMEMPLTSGRIYFSPKQDLHGYSKPWVGGTGKNKVNYLDPANWRVATNTNIRATEATIGSISASNGTVTLTRTSTYAGLTIILGQLKAGTTYTISGTFNCDGTAYIAKLDEEEITADYTCTRVATPTFVDGVVQFTPEEDGIYELLLWKTSTGNVSVSNLQLELGSTATAYEPYENICPIEGWDGIEITRCGKNLINPLQEELDKFINANGVPGNLSGFIRTGFIPVKYGINYTISGISTYGGTAAIRIHGYDEDNKYIKQVYGYSTAKVSYSYSFNISDDRVKYVRISAPISDEFQFEIGSTKTSYTPYTDLTTITIPFDHTIYGGYVDLISGEVVETYDKYEFTGNESLGWHSWGNDFSIMLLNKDPSKKSSLPFKGTENGYCNMLQNVKSRMINIPSGSISAIGTDTLPNFTYLVVNNSGFGETLEECKAKLQELYANGTPLTYVGEVKSVYLETIYTYPLTMQPITTLSGTNNLWTNSNGDAQISYYRHSDDSYQYINAQAIASNNNYLLVTDDGFVIGNEENVTVY